MKSPFYCQIIVITILCSYPKCFTFATNSSTSPVVDYQPRHVHLSSGEDSETLIVTWSTLDKTNQSIVLIGVEELSEQVSGTSRIFVDSGELKAFQFIHTVIIKHLIPNQYYMYSVGSDLGWSPSYEMKTLKAGSDWSPVIAMFGDMGNENAVSLPHLQKGALENDFDMIIHVGDFAYDMYEENGSRGDVFMEQIEPIATRVPYMTCPGNHEMHYNFSNYKARFGNSMPGDEGRMFYTFTVGPVRFFSVSTEYYYYYLEDGMVYKQYAWLQQQLKKANSKEEREKHPWLVVFGHRPMYCSNTDHDDCTKYETKTRVGFAPFYQTGLEKLLYDYGVDLAVWAHEHSYERLLPIYNRTIMSGANPNEPYTNPGATVHITSGSAGCREDHSPFVPDPPEWSVFRSPDYGYTIMQASNKTHLNIRQISVEQDNKVIDQFWIIKDKHQSFKDPISAVHHFDPLYLYNLEFVLVFIKVLILMLMLACLYVLFRSHIKYLAYRNYVYSRV